MRFKVVCFGSAFVDVYLQSPDFKIMRAGSSPTGVALCEVYGGKIPVTKMVMTTGGGATNVSVGLERLGLQTAAVCAVGDDHWGLFVRKDLNREGVSPLYIQEVDAPTSYSTILVSEDGGRSALVYRGASNELKWNKVDWDKLDADWFYVSSLGGDFDLLTKIVRTAQEKKIRIAINPGSQEISKLNKLKPFLKYVEVLIVNIQEAAKLTEHLPKNAKEIFADLIKWKIPVVAVTEGRKGANLIAGKKVLTLPAIKVKTVEETGAGDGFSSGFMAGIIQGSKLNEALKMGLVSGASVATQFGPKAGLLFAPEMKAWLKKI
jgi:ribokinase